MESVNMSETRSSVNDDRYRKKGVFPLFVIIALSCLMILICGYIGLKYELWKNIVDVVYNVTNMEKYNF